MRYKKLRTEEIHGLLIIQEEIANTIYRIVKAPATGNLYAATSGIHDMYESTRLGGCTA